MDRAVEHFVEHSIASAYAYPSTTDQLFSYKLCRKKELYAFRKKKETRSPEELFREECVGQQREFVPTLMQNALQHVMSPHTPYRTITLIGGPGVGKTHAALLVAKQFFINILSMVSSGIFTRDTRPYIYIISSEESKRNFIKSLFVPIYGIFSKDEYDTLKPLSTSSEQYSVLYKMYSKRIQKHYKFITFQTFQNMTIGSTGKIKKGVVKDNPLEHIRARGSLIIVDEIHRLYNSIEMNQFGNSIIQVMKREPTIKLLGLTGTIISTSVKELITFVNLMSPEFQPVTYDDLFEKRNKGTTTLSKHGESVLKERLRGKISYIKGYNPVIFPTRIMHGKVLTEHGFKSHRLTQCLMPENQYKAYKQLDKNNSAKMKVPLDEARVFDIVFPPLKHNSVGVYRTDDYKGLINYSTKEWRDKYGLHFDKNGEPHGPFFGYSSIKKWSAKSVMLLHILKNAEGKTLVYHDATHIFGTRALGQLLLQNGYIQWSPGTTEKTPKSFIVYDGDVPQDERKLMDDTFDSVENIHGDIIKIKVGGQVTREVIDHNCIMNVILFHVPPTMPMMVQIIGRGERRCSHALLPPEKRVINVWTLVSSVPKDSLSREEYKCLQMERRYIEIKRIEEIIRTIAYDCMLFRHYNISEIEQPSKAKKQCDYMSCDYKCEPHNVLDKLFDKKTDSYVIPDSQIDVYTFNSYYFNMEVEVAKTIINQIFGSVITTVPIYTLVQLIDAVKNGSVVRYTNYDTHMIDERAIVLAIEDIISSEEPFIADTGTEYTLRQAGEYYVPLPANCISHIDAESCIMPVKSSLCEAHISVSSYIARHSEKYKTEAGDATNVRNRLASMYERAMPPGHVTTKALSKFLEMGSQVQLSIQTELISDAIVYFYNLLTKKAKQNKELDKVELFVNNIIMTAYWISNILITVSTAKMAGIIKNGDVQYDTSYLENTMPFIAKGFSYYEFIRKNTNDSTLVIGYMLPGEKQEGRIFDPNKRRWETHTVSISFLTREWKENDVIIGFFYHFKKIGRIVLKFRLPLQQLKKTFIGGDQRFRKKGNTCEYMSRDDLIKIMKALGVSQKTVVTSIDASFGVMSAYSGALIERENIDKSGKLALCLAIERELIMREISERKKGSNVKWFYHLFEKMPTL
jgi:superfamily II DNA or RNA helicase